MNFWQKEIEFFKSAALVLPTIAALLVQIQPTVMP